MFRKINIPNLYISLWFLNTLQGMYVKSSLVSMLFFIPFILISFYYVYEAIAKYPSNKYIKGLFILYLVLVVYGIFNILIGRSFAMGHHIRSNREFLLGVLLSLTPIFAFYVFTIKGYLKESTIVKWIIPFIILTTLEYQKANEMLMIRYLSSDFDEFTNNVGFTFLSLAPLVFFLYKKPVYQYLLLGYIMFFTISSMKRGAIVIGIVFLLWFLTRTFGTVSRKKKIVVCFTSFLLVIVGYYFIENLLLTSDYFQFRVQQTLEGNSSGRDNLYSTILETFVNNSGLFTLLFGHGADSTIALAGNLAHSDWLELLCDCGIFGVLVYTIYWVRFYKIWMLLKYQPLLYSLLGACFIITFIKAIFSMSYNEMSFYICLSIGYCVGEYYKKRRSMLSK